MIIDILIKFSLFDPLGENHTNDNVNIDVINVKNFEYAYDGKLAFGYYENEHCHRIEITSYCVEDITNAFEEFINKMEV